MNKKIILFTILIILLLIISCAEDDIKPDLKDNTEKKPIQDQEKQQVDSQDGDAMYKRSFSTPQDPEIYLSQVKEESSNTWQYQTTMLTTTEPGNDYDVGAFCRIFQREDGNYDITYGGSFGQYERDYAGIVHRILNSDFTFTEEDKLFSEHVTDSAIDSDGEYYYFSKGDPKGWKIEKFDLNFDLVDSVVIELPENHMGNDQMLRVYNGYVFASGMYDPEYTGERKLHTEDGDIYTHMWIYTNDLEYVNDVMLDDYINSNGETLIYYDGIYAHVTADKFMESTLIAMLYDEDWNYIETIELQDDAQWSMGGQYVDGLIYIAYHKGLHGAGDVFVDIYDTEWNLQETIEVTNVEQGFNAQRPWIQIYDDKMFVSYDVGDENAMICLASIYEKAE